MNNERDKKIKKRKEIINEIDKIVTEQCRPCNDKVLGEGKAQEQRKRDIYCFNECKYGGRLRELGRLMDQLAKSKNTRLITALDHE